MDQNPDTKSLCRSLDTQTISIFVFIFSFLLAVLVSSFVFISPIFSLLIIFVGGIIFVIEKILKGKLEKEVLFIIVFLISFGLGTLRYSIKDFHITQEKFETNIGEDINLEGLVISELELRDNSSRFVLESDGEKILVSTDLYSDVLYGDYIRASGKLNRPGLIENEDGDRAFDYAKYLSKDDIYYTLSFAKTDLISHGQGNLIKEKLFTIKRKFVSKIKDILSEPESSLLAGLIVSGKEAMPQSILEEFRRAGVIHIVVLSGYNVAIIAEFIRKIFEGLLIFSRAPVIALFAMWPSVIAILFFVLMTGAEATVVRASIMVLTVILAKSFGRNYSASRALITAGFIMVIWNPKILVFDPSFQLSFLATLALIYVVPIVEKNLLFITNKFKLRSLISTTLATQITVLPFLVYSMGDLSVVSLLANILILPIIPLTMLIGFIASILGFISTILAWPVAYATHLLLGWILGVSHYLGTLSFASVKVPSFPFWLVVLIYLGLVIFVRQKNLSQHFAIPLESRDQ